MSAVSLPYRLLAPGVALLRRRLQGRWWDHSTATSDQVVSDQIKRPGRQTFGDGVGAVVERRYSITLDAPDTSPEDVIEWFCSDPDAQRPTSYAAFSDPILREGQKVTVQLAGPWNGPVEVIQRTPTTIVLGTLDGHMEAGWIAFDAQRLEEDDADGTSGMLRFSIVSAARAGDPAFWLLHVLARVGQWVQADMWASVLEGAAAHVGDRTSPRVRVSTITHDQQPEDAPAVADDELGDDIRPGSDAG